MIVGRLSNDDSSVMAENRITVVSALCFAAYCCGVIYLCYCRCYPSVFVVASATVCGVSAMVFGLVLRMRRDPPRFQFSLRTLMIVVTVSAALSAAVTSVVNEQLRANHPPRSTVNSNR